MKAQKGGTMQRHFLRFVGWMMALAVVSTGFVLPGARQAKAEDLSVYLSKPQWQRRQESMQRMQDLLQGIAHPGRPPRRSSPRRRLW